MNYKRGRMNLAATIFVPWDCSNNCPFCVSKKLYKDNENNNELLLANIRLINKTDGITDIVLTGGEPFDLSHKEDLISLIESLSLKKKLIINSTLPIRPDDEDDFFDLLKTITDIRKHSLDEKVFINVSRHMSSKLKSIASDDFLKKVSQIKGVSLRINCVIDDDFLNKGQDVKEFAERFYPIPVCFRADFRHMTFEKLKNPLDEYVKFFLDLGFDYTIQGGCLVCHTVEFKNNNQSITYHRGMEQSSIQIGDSIVINDIIIMPNSHMYYDWDMKAPEDMKTINVLKDLGYDYLHAENCFSYRNSTKNVNKKSSTRSHKRKLDYESTIGGCGSFSSRC